jgi:flagellar protein FlaF
MSDASHSRAAGAYGSAAASTDQRALEGQVLLKSAQKLEDLMNRLKSGEKVDVREVGDVLDHNQKLWILLSTDATEPSSPLSLEIKNNIATLAAYIFTRTLDIRADARPEKLQILITINRNIASGLMKKNAAASPPPAGSGRTEADSLA